MPNDTLPDWEQVLTLTDLRQHFDEVLAELEAVAGWETARV